MQRKLLYLAFAFALTVLFTISYAQDARIPGSSRIKRFVIIQEPPQAKLVGKNNKVSFYQMPQDHMICVVPNDRNSDPINVWRNNDSTRIQQNIPNRIPRSKIIPDSSGSLAPSTSFRLPRFNGNIASPYGN